MQPFMPDLTTDNSNNNKGGNFRVALVNPPFGPFGIASLGLSILAGGVKQRGFHCKTFYWNIDLVKAMPFADKKALYNNLSFQFLFPANEWAFSNILYPEGRVTSKEEMRQLFFRTSESYGEGDRRERYWKLTEWLDDCSQNVVNDMVDKLESYDLIGINTTFFQNIPGLALAKTIKERWPDKKVVFGGANCNGEMGQTLIEQFDFVDIIFLGEADLTFPELVQRLSEKRSYEDIPGITFRKKNQVYTTEKDNPINDLDVVPIPCFEDYISQYQESGLQEENKLLLPLETSRGCWWGKKYHCTFCGLNAENMTQRQKTWDHIVEEVDFIASKYDASYFFMTDNIFYWKHLDKFLEFNKDREKKLNFFYEVRPTGKRNQVKKLVQSGITMVQPGIEHFSTKILKMIDKHLVGIENIAFLKYAREYGLRPAYNIICLFPNEDPAEYERLARELPKVSHLAPPNGLNPVQYHRYSPYFYTPEKFSIKLVPYKGYRYIYPFETDTLHKLAYHYDLAEKLESPKDGSHLTELNNVINEWRSVHLEDRCLLTWDIEGEDIVIEDRRPGFPDHTFRLQDSARDVFYAFDSPMSLNSGIKHVENIEASSWMAFKDEFEALFPVQRSKESAFAEFFAELVSVGDGFGSSEGVTEGETIISFSKQELFMEPKNCIEKFVDANLMYEEADQYLSLPVYVGQQRTDPAWQLFDL